MNAHCPITIVEPTLEEVNEALHASLCRCIESAPVENKLKLFHAMARTTAAEIVERKLQTIDDLWRSPESSASSRHSVRWQCRAHLPPLSSRRRCNDLDMRIIEQEDTSFVDSCGRADEQRHVVWGDTDWSILDDRRGELPEFPTDALSVACRDWVGRAARGAGVTSAHVAIPLIGIASSIIGTSRRVMASRSFTQPMTTWTALVGFSGSGKTPGIDATKRALALVERNRRVKIDEMRRSHETRRETAKVARDEWKKKLSDIAGGDVVDLGKYRSTTAAKPEMPPEAEDPGPFVAPQLYVSNATIERLAELLKAQPRGALLLSDELAALFLNMSRYSGGQDNEFWLEAWNGGGYTVERMSRSVAIDHLLIGVVGGLQPDKLSRSFNGDLDGMYARVLFAWPPEPSYRPLADDVSEVEPEVVNAIARLVELEAGESKDGGFAPRAVPLAEAAKERFEQFRQFLHGGKDALDGRERDWWAKMPAHALRLAGTIQFLAFAFVGGPEPTEIDDCSMEAGIRLVREYFWPHARAALRQIGLSDRHLDARRVLRWVKAKDKPEVTREDIRRHALGQKLDAEATDKLLDALERGGWLKKIVEPSGPKGGRPTSRWLVNPILFKHCGNCENCGNVHQ
jgi:Protein of unknown function (DUF3987)